MTRQEFVTYVQEMGVDLMPIQFFTADGAPHALARIELIGTNDVAYPEGISETPPFVKITLE